MTVYAAQIASAKRLIAAKGSTITFNRSTEASYDPATDSETGASVTVYTGSAVILPISGGGSEFDARYPGIVEARTNHRELLVAADGMTESPRAGDVAKDVEGEDWTVIGSEALSPDNGAPIIHTLTIKR